MVAPNFRRATDTAVDGTNVKYGAPDLTHAFNVLDGSHANQRIQASVIEGRQKPFNCTINFEGTNIVARNADGGVISSGTNATTVLNAGVATGGHIFIGPGTYNTTAAISVPSNTHIEADVNTLVRGAGTHATITNSNNTVTEPAMGNSYIILEGGTWDGFSDNNTIFGNTANVHFHGVEWVWVNRVRSINSISEGIKVRNCKQCYITNCYVDRSKLDSDGTGKAGIMCSLIAHECIVTDNIITDSGGEAIGAYQNCGRLVIANNVCKYLGLGSTPLERRCYILIEGSSVPSTDFVRDELIVGNTVISKYQCINFTGTDGLVIANNCLTNVGKGVGVGQASARGDGIRCHGVNRNIHIVGNYIHDVEQHGMYFINDASNFTIEDNMIINVSDEGANLYDGISFDVTNPFDNVKITNNLIGDDRGTPQMRYGIRYDHNAQTYTNHWVSDNQIYGYASDAIRLWVGEDGRFTGEVRFVNNSKFNSAGKVDAPFNNTHSQIGIPIASTSQITFAQTPTSGTVYKVVTSPISVTSTGGAGVTITVREPASSNVMFTGSTCNGIYLPIGWTIQWTYSTSPAASNLHVVGV
jgi:hypothetical protein